jgi:alkylation response protein AidB-like acyl-CoA dehydrogenase
MEFSFTDEENAFRQEVKDFLDTELPKDFLMPVLNPASDLYRPDVWELHKVMAKKLAKKGWLALTWPKAYGGQEATPMISAIFHEEIGYRGAPGIDNQGVGMIGPLLIHFGSEEQKKQHIPPIVRGEIFWCEGFSEPEAGSDLASAKMLAADKGDHYVLNGQKLWTSGSSVCDWCHMLARTEVDVPKKHHGLSYFLVDMKTPGITVRPIRDMCEGQSLCEVFFDNVKVPTGNMVGKPGQGWELSLALLNFERGAGVGEVGRMHGLFDLLIRYLAENNMLDDPKIRKYIADFYIEMETARMISYQMVWLAGEDLPASSQASINKLFQSESVQRCSNIIMKILGSYGQLINDSKWSVLQGRFTHDYFEQFSATLARGTSEIQRNVLATRGLGLPRG